MGGYSNSDPRQNPAGAVIAGIMMMIMSFIFAGMGFPWIFSVFAFLAGMIAVILSFASYRRHESEAEERVTAAEEAQERFKEEVAEAVKESIKGTIKIRCRYCGSLNDENANRCDSCGATL